MQLASGLQTDSRPQLLAADDNKGAHLSFSNTHTRKQASPLLCQPAGLSAHHHPHHSLVFYPESASVLRVKYDNICQ